MKQIKPIALGLWASGLCTLALAGCASSSGGDYLSASAGQAAGLDKAQLNALIGESGRQFGGESQCEAYLDQQLDELLLASDSNLYAGVGNVRAQGAGRSFTYGTKTHHSPLPPRPGEPPRPGTIVDAIYSFQCDGGQLVYILQPIPQ